MSRPQIEVQVVAVGEGPDPASARPDWLAARGWLSQDLQLRGSCLATQGLAEAGHPELAMLNVPGVFVGEAQALLTRVATALVEGEELAEDVVLLAVDETEVPGLKGPAFRVLPL